MCLESSMQVKDACAHSPQHQFSCSDCADVWLPLAKRPLCRFAVSPEPAVGHRRLHPDVEGHSLRTHLQDGRKKHDESPCLHMLASSAVLPPPSSIAVRLRSAAGRQRSAALAVGMLFHASCAMHANSCMFPENRPPQQPANWRCTATADPERTRSPQIDDLEAQQRLKRRCSTRICSAGRRNCCMSWTSFRNRVSPKPWRYAGAPAANIECDAMC